MSDRKFKAGQIVRYSGGPTALCRLRSPHDGSTDGWHAEQFFGGILFISERELSPATRDDVVKFVEEQRERKKR